jgi:hypothetical protein
VSNSTRGNHLNDTDIVNIVKGVLDQRLLPLDTEHGVYFVLTAAGGWWCSAGVASRWDGTLAPLTPTCLAWHPYWFYSHGCTHMVLIICLGDWGACPLLLLTPPHTSAPHSSSHKRSSLLLTHPLTPSHTSALTLHSSACHTDVTESNDDGTAFCTSYCGWHWVFGYTQTDAVKFGFIGRCRNRQCAVMPTSTCSQHGGPACMS